MNSTRIVIFARLTIVLALLTAMTGTAYAHSFGPPMPPALQAFLQAGGTLDDLCSTTHDSHDMANQTCAACHLVATAMLPALAAANHARLRIPVRLAQTTKRLARCQTISDPSRPVRAPPVV